MQIFMDGFGESNIIISNSFFCKSFFLTEGHTCKMGKSDQNKSGPHHMFRLMHLDRHNLQGSAQPQKAHGLLFSVLIFLKYFYFIFYYFLLNNRLIPNGYYITQWVH